MPTISIVTEEEFPPPEGPLRCGECDCEIPYGAPYVSKPAGEKAMAEWELEGSPFPVYLLVCLDCGGEE